MDPTSLVPALHLRLIRRRLSTRTTWSKAPLAVVADPSSGAAELRQSGQDYLVLHPDAFEAELGGRQAQLDVWVEPSGDGTTREHLLLDQVLPRVLAHRGLLLLHASAVLIGERAVCFVAASGVGKSTLAAMLAAQGCPLLADDVVRIEVAPDDLFVHPGYPSLRLWEDSTALVPVRHVRSVAPMADYSSKHVFRLLDSRCHSASARLGALVLLGENAPADSDVPRTHVLSPAAALIRLMGQSFSLHPGLAAVESIRLRDMARVCALSRPVELCYRRDYQHAAALLDCLKRQQGPA
ncbi:MAG: hypothetical protein ACT4NL_06650 [Pseudomarimonas sp.]